MSMDSTLLTGDERTLTQEMSCAVSYDDIEAAVRQRGTHYEMSIPVECEDGAAIIAALGMAIDSRLQACYVPARGDEYGRGERGFTAKEDGINWNKGDKVVHTVTLDCKISPESLPVLLNRLFDADCCSSLGASILYSLGFDDMGKFIGREACGLD